MIRARELRIGNAVFVPSRNEYMYVTASNILDISQGIIKADKVEITEFWLLRMGFKKLREGQYAKKSLLVEQDFNDKWVARIRVSLSRSHPVKGELTIHGLQNLYFSLEGEELLEKYMKFISTIA